MQRTTFTVSLDRSRRDAFVLASQAFLTNTAVPLFGRALPPVVVLRLSFAEGREAFVGCLTQHAHHGATHKLLVPFSLARDIDVQDGALIEADVVAHVPRASKVLVAPLTVDESEVVEQNALRLEGELLRQVQVVYPSMTITVNIFAGVQARLRVERIECGEAGVVLSHGAALMFDGTHFIVATRPRVQGDVGVEGETSGTAPPMWSILRALPSSSAEAGAAKDDDGSRVDAEVVHTVRVHRTTAARLHWRSPSSAVMLDAIDLAALAEWTEAKITPAFLRPHTTVVRLQITNDVDDDGSVPVDCCVVTPTLRQATNLLLLPRPVAESATRGIDGQQQQQREAETRTGCDAATTPTSPPVSRLTVDALRAVHGGVVDDVLDHLRLAFTDAAVGVTATNANVLLTGGRGYGKSTLLATILCELPRVRAVWLECTSGKSFLPALQRAVRECVLTAPAVLVLDNFDAVAPAQAEGAVTAMTNATCATLEAVLRTFTTLRGFAAAGDTARVVVAATCVSREGVSEALRGAECFAHSFAVEALTLTTRTALVGQLFADAAATTVRRMASMMDNYTPFDVVHVAARIRGDDDDKGDVAAAREGDDGTMGGDEALVRRAERTTGRFTPLAHTGIKFLKGDKLAWADIGGLAEAKKALYDTLVLPMKHRELFARLPLKTRSGILLYGPSGCGKTFILEALVNAEQLNCIVVNGPEVFGKYIGQSEQKIRDVFERAQAAAPCVVFFDEFDSVAPQRGLDNSGVTDRVVNQLLCYLDGVEGRKDVYVVAASSRPDLIDAALLRPGRLDKAVQCPVPTLADREAILRSLLTRTVTQCDVADTDIHDLAVKTPNWTPADLAAMVSTANTLVSQRVLDEIAQQAHEGKSSSEAAEMTGPSDAAPDEAGGAFVIAGLAKGVVRDKVVDALQRFAQDASRHGSARSRVTSALQSTTLTRTDLVAAMAATRPSLSQRDIERQARIHALFSHGHVPVAAKPGTKLTYR